MTHKFHTEKHLKKRQRHLMGQPHVKPPEKMAERKEKTTEAKLPIEPPAKSPEAMPSTALPTPTPVPVKTPTLTLIKKKNWFEKLKDKFHQVIDHI